MGRELTDLSFEQWVEYVFDHPVTKPEWHWDIDRDYWNAEKKPAITVSYLTQLFTQPVEALAAYTDAQINQSFWYLVHSASSNYLFTLRDTNVPLQDRETCIEGIYTLFEKLFATRCTPALGHLSEEGNPLNSVCYMWWDLISLRGRPKGSYVEKLDVSPERREELMAYVRSFDADDYRQIEYTSINVMKQILELNSDACRESALHGLGHWSRHYGKAIQNIIDKWLKRHPYLRPELREYAELAKYDGNR